MWPTFGHGAGPMEVPLCLCEAFYSEAYQRNTFTISLKLLNSRPLVFRLSGVKLRSSVFPGGLYLIYRPGLNGACSLFEVSSLVILGNPESRFLSMAEQRPVDTAASVKVCVCCCVWGRRGMCDETDRYVKPGSVE